MTDTDYSRYIEISEHERLLLRAQRTMLFWGATITLLAIVDCTLVSAYIGRDFSAAWFFMWFGGVVLAIPVAILPTAAVSWPLHGFLSNRGWFQG